MKVLFLDFDGVLNNWKYDNPWLGNCKLKDGYTDRDQFGFLFDTTCVQNLKTIIDATDAKIVISSSWRHLGLDKILVLWNERKLPGEVIDIIPLNDSLTTGNYESLSRGDCIAEWLSQNPVEGYLIIDDTDDFLAVQKKYFVQTERDDGLTSFDVEIAIALSQTS